MVGTSEVMQRLYRVIAKIAPTDLTVLISGETGTGKELAARALHVNSKRASSPFVAINCATLGEHLLESELFGHERGAFTGAVATKRGKFEIADRGTIFLDEIGELPVALQAKLLRALQQREFERVGGTRADQGRRAGHRGDQSRPEGGGRGRPLPAGLVFPAGRLQLADAAAARPARRISGCWRNTSRLWPANAAIVLQSASLPKPCSVSPAYDWPGNVREFENVIERAVVLSSEAEIVPEDLPEGLGPACTRRTEDESRFHAAVDEAKRRVIREAHRRSRRRNRSRRHAFSACIPNYLHRLLNTLNLRPSGRPEKGGKVH